MVFPVAAVEIRYTATDLADVAPGEDLWRYDYRLLDVTFAANQGFSIFFDSSLVISIQTPPLPVAPGWDVLILQPLPGIPSDGL